MSEGLLAARRAKLDALRARGIDPFPHAFPGVVPTRRVRDENPELAPDTHTGRRYRLAGRLAAHRGAGRRMAFLDLVDRAGRLQVLVLAEPLLERLQEVDLGDWVGVDGEAFTTRRGELSLLADELTVLAKSLRPPPEKHHGVRDVETRHRFRELDLMANEETRELFVARARTVSAVRAYLDGEGFVEVETPVLQPVYGGALARPFTTHHNALDRTLFLRIATELYLKRCIVGGLERVYELGKDFRNEGVDTKHNPEFTMVEWYEAYADWASTADRLEALVSDVAAAVGATGGIDWSSPWPRVPLVDAIAERTGIDVLRTRGDREALRAEIDGQGLGPAESDTWHELVDDLLSKHVEPRLLEPTLIVDYPVELSPFAKAHRERPGFVERFEAFAGGMEFANAFSELNDPDEQRARFDEQRRHAEAGDEEAQPFDEAFLAALELGMPPTGGIGVGIDRLVMLLMGRTSIREVVLFPAMRDG